ncbi:MAG TPA: APC family permease [Phycisphaerae bacterium]|nr:APC family permease [Phycisphaerae bacterium]
MDFVDRFVSAHPALRRQVGLTGAVLMGLGSILGTGVFVSLATAAGIAGTPVIAACVAAGALAGCNGLSAAELAAAHPVSGGTYEYGQRFLTPPVAFTAGWLFLLAKSASAATAALGFAAYLLHACHAEPTYALRVPVAAGVTGLMTALTVAGVKRSNAANGLIVGVTVASLVVFAAAALRRATVPSVAALLPAGAGMPAFLHGAALLFVAYTGYGRVATLGEEVHDPRRTIPRAMVVTLALTAALYVAVAAGAVFTVGAGAFGGMASSGGAPLTGVAEALKLPGAAWLLAAGAMTAMLGVLLNLLLGLSRVLLAMARRGDMPHGAARLNAGRTTPYVAVVTMGAVVAGLTLLGDVKTAWSFSAFMVLIYYALTNIAALRLPRELRLFPQVVPAAGLAGCLGLAFWVDAGVWMTGLGLIVLGLGWHAVARRAAR